MAQHFLLSAQARTLSLVQMARMSQGQAEATFEALRWHETDIKLFMSNRDALADLTKDQLAVLLASAEMMPSLSCSDMASLEGGRGPGYLPEGEFAP